MNTSCLKALVDSTLTFTGLRSVAPDATNQAQKHLALGLKG
jgi:hypothetical protein